MKSELWKPIVFGIAPAMFSKQFIQQVQTLYALALGLAKHPGRNLGRGFQHMMPTPRPTAQTQQPLHRHRERGRKVQACSDWPPGNTPEASHPSWKPWELGQPLTLSTELGLLQHADNVISGRQVGKLFFQDGENVLLLLRELRVHAHPLEQDAAWKAWVQMLLSSLSTSQDRSSESQVLMLRVLTSAARLLPTPQGTEFGRKEQYIAT